MALANQTIPDAPGPSQKMSKFESVFRLWLAGYGVEEQHRDALCSHARLGRSLRARDSGGLVIDLPISLAGIPQALEIGKALQDPREQLMLMMLLDK